MSDPTHSQPSPPTQDQGRAADDWSNYWQGRTAQDAGVALVGVGIESNAELEALWTRELDGAEGPLLDIACGAGTVLRTASALGLAPLHGIDVSAEALTALEREVSDVRTAVADAASLPFADAGFATVTSQFGIEYADRAAFDEAMRVLAPGGRLRLVCHNADGAIAAEVRGKRDGAVALEASAFVERAKALFMADDNGFKLAAAAFRPAQDAVLTIAKGGDSLARHLYAGTQTLHARRASYAVSDMTGWLDGMASQIAAFRGRMQSMLDAALEADEAQVLATRLSGTAELLSLGGRRAAWLIRADKPA